MRELRIFGCEWKSVQPTRRNSLGMCFSPRYSSRSHPCVAPTPHAVKYVFPISDAKVQQNLDICKKNRKKVTITLQTYVVQHKKIAANVKICRYLNSTVSSCQFRQEALLKQIRARWYISHQVREVYRPSGLRQSSCTGVVRSKSQRLYLQLQVD